MPLQILLWHYFQHFFLGQRKKIEENYPKWIFLQSRYINSVYFI